MFDDVSYESYKPIDLFNEVKRNIDFIGRTLNID